MSVFDAIERAVVNSGCQYHPGPCIESVFKDQTLVHPKCAAVAVLRSLPYNHEVVTTVRAAVHRAFTECRDSSAVQEDTVRNVLSDLGELGQ